MSLDRLAEWTGREALLPLVMDPAVLAMLMPVAARQSPATLNHFRAELSAWMRGLDTEWVYVPGVLEQICFFYTPEEIEARTGLTLTQASALLIAAGEALDLLAANAGAVAS